MNWFYDRNSRFQWSWQVKYHTSIKYVSSFFRPDDVHSSFRPSKIVEGRFWDEFRTDIDANCGQLRHATSHCTYRTQIYGCGGKFTKFVLLRRPVQKQRQQDFISSGVVLYNFPTLARFIAELPSHGKNFEFVLPYTSDCALKFWSEVTTAQLRLADGSGHNNPELAHVNRTGQLWRTCGKPDARSDQSWSATAVSSLKFLRLRHRIHLWFCS